VDGSAPVPEIYPLFAKDCEVKSDIIVPRTVMLASLVAGEGLTEVGGVESDLEEVEFK